MNSKVVIFINGGVVVADGAVAAANLLNSAISVGAMVFVARMRLKPRRIVDGDPFNELWSQTA